MPRVNQQAFLQSIRKAVHSVDPQAELYLFGSRARGNHRRDSDWDILVLTQQTRTLSLKYAILDKLTELEIQTGNVINAVIRQKEEWPTWSMSPFYRNVIEEGVRL